MTKKPLPFEVLEAEGAEQQPVIFQILQNAFDAFDEDYVTQKYKWLNELNPAGFSLSYLLKDLEAESAIGTHSICKREFVYSGKKLAAGVMIDFAVDRSYRSLGPAMFLLKNATKDASDKLSFLYGFPNRKAAPVFKRAGARSLGETRRMVRVLTSEKYIKDKVPDWLLGPVSSLLNLGVKAFDYACYLYASASVTAHWSEVPDELIDQLWQTSEYNQVMLSRRDAKTLNWRPLNGVKYTDLNTVLFTDRKNDNSPLGYITYYLNGDSVQVLDFFVKAPDSVLVRKIWLSFLWRVRKFHKTNVFFEFFGPEEIRKGLASVGFIKRESANIILIPGTDDVPESEENWYITSFDRDT